MEIALVLIVVVVGYLVLAGKAHNKREEQGKHVEVALRERLSFLLAAEMKRWRAATNGYVHPMQHWEASVEWVLKQAPVHPQLAAMIAKSAHVALLREAILSDCDDGLALLRSLESKERTLTAHLKERGYATGDALDQWWDDVDYWFDTLKETYEEHATRRG